MRTATKDSMNVRNEEIAVGKNTTKGNIVIFAPDSLMDRASGLMTTANVLNLPSEQDVIWLAAALLERTGKQWEELEDQVYEEFFALSQQNREEPTDD